MHKLISLFSQTPFFLFLLPLFFVLHGFTAYYFLVPVKETIAVLFVFLAASFLLALAFLLIYKNRIKSALASVLLLALNFFFGNIQDGLKEIAPGSFIIKYSFLLPLALVVFIIWAVYLKRSKNNFTRLTAYLNWLVLLFLFIDMGILCTKFSNNNSVVAQPQPQLNKCTHCEQPDVYFIVADEYPGKQVLAEIFSFDNSSFESELTRRGFHVIKNTKSNYNWTPYSIASTLHMNYLQLKTNEVNIYDLLVCEDEIKASPVIHFFKEAGYRIYNHSIFKLNEKQSLLQPLFLYPRKRLLTSTTFIDRFQKDLGFHFKSNTEIESGKKIYLYNTLKADSLTKSIVAQNVREKKFVYTHLMLPHHPYFFDSTGKANPSNAWEDDHKLNKQAFISYLIYSNKKLLELVDSIKTASKHPPVIILISDHGFRQFSNNTSRDYYFMNLNAVYLPNQNYSAFYEGISNVNMFRLLLNNQFGQQLPLLKDSSIFLWEK